MPGFNQTTFLHQLLVYSLLGLAVLIITYFLFWKFRAFSYSRLKPHQKRFAIFIGSIAVIAFIYWFPVYSATNDKGEVNLELEDKFRKTWAQVIGGVVLAIGAWLTHRRVKATEEQVKASQQQVKAMQEGNRSQAFKDAVELLGHKEQDVRIGAIYALEQVANEDPERYHWPVMEILAAYLREKASVHSLISSNNNDMAEIFRSLLDDYGVIRWEDRPFVSSLNNSDYVTSNGKFKNDLQSALNVIGMREVSKDKKRLDLTRVNFYFADFSELKNFSYIDFSGSVFNHVNFAGSKFEGAYFIGCIIFSSKFIFGDLRKAKFNDAYFYSVDFNQCNNLDIQQLKNTSSICKCSFEPDFLRINKGVKWLNSCVDFV